MFTFILPLQVHSIFFYSRNICQISLFPPIYIISKNDKFPTPNKLINFLFFSCENLTWNKCSFAYNKDKSKKNVCQQHSLNLNYCGTFKIFFSRLGWRCVDLTLDGYKKGKAIQFLMLLRDPLQSSPNQKCIILKICICDPMLVKPKCVWEV